MAQTVPEMLEAAAKLYRERNAIYKNNYKHFGETIRSLFQGKPILLETETEVLRFALFVQIAGKLSRYAAAFHAGGHKDSLDDMAVYAMMLAEIDEETKP